MSRDNTRQLGLMGLMISSVGILGSHVHLSPYASLLWAAAMLLLAAGAVRLGVQVYRGDK